MALLFEAVVYFQQFKEGLFLFLHDNALMHKANSMKKWISQFVVVY